MGKQGDEMYLTKKVKQTEKKYGPRSDKRGLMAEKKSKFRY